MGKKLTTLDLRQVVAANLLRLMEYASVHGDEQLTTLRGIEERTGVGKSTLSRTIKQQTGIGIDHLAPLAQAFGVQPWHLLWPDLDPSNPPTMPITQTERDLYERIKQMAEELRKPHGEEDPGEGDGAHSDPAGTTKRQKVSAKPSPRRPAKT